MLHKGLRVNGRSPLRNLPLFGIFSVFACTAVVSVLLVLLIRPGESETAEAEVHAESRRRGGL